MAETYNITTQILDGDIWLSGIAYIVLPADIDRGRYITESYRTSTVSIYSEHNGYFNRVPIDRFSLNFIEFPQNPKEFGSAVSFKIDPIQKRPIIDGIYFKDDELCDLVENQFKFKRVLNGNTVEISGSPDGKNLLLNVSADVAGQIDINVQSKDESGSVNINVEGECNITSSQNTLIKQFNKFTLATVNKTDINDISVMEQTNSTHLFIDEEHKILTDKLNINDGAENFVLGQKLKKFLDDLITEISNATVTTGIGQMPLLNATQIAAYTNRTEELLSEIGFINK
jgi:hypothetical protein